MYKNNVEKYTQQTRSILRTRKKMNKRARENVELYFTLFVLTLKLYNGGNNNIK